MIKELIKLATHLDSKGLSKEADYLDSIIKKEALFSKVKNMTSECSGFSCGKHSVKYYTTDTTKWNGKLYNKATQFFGREVSKDEISFEIAHLICSNVHNKIPKNSWSFLPPHVEGSQNRQSVLGFNVDGGKVTYNKTLTGGWVNAHTGFDWDTFDAKDFQTAVQATVNNYANLLSDPGFKFELIIGHGFR